MTDKRSFATLWMTDKRSFDFALDDKMLVIPTVREESLSLITIVGMDDSVHPPRAKLI